MLTRPPRGITPYWIFYKRRIKEILEGMIRFLEHYDAFAEDNERYRKLISSWCDELKLLMEFEGKLQNIYYGREV